MTVPSVPSVQSVPPLPLPLPPPPVAGERLDFGGGLVAWTAGSGPPLLLVHSINAAASAAEMRPIFDHSRATRTAFAIDLPGYGASRRDDIRYSPRLMTDALHAAAAQIRRHCGTAPLDAVALSLSCEFLARAAAEQPSQWGRLALVSPTGFRGTRPYRGAPGSTRAVPGLYRVLSQPLWASALYRGLTRPGVIRYFLERTWGSKAIDETLWAHDVLVARQPGARHAPLYFLSGGLFSADITTVYEALAQPVWVSHGVRGDFTDYRGLAGLKTRANWRVSVYPTGALPQFEEMAAFGAELDRFLATPG